MAYTIIPDRVLSCLSGLLVSSQMYRVTIGSHETVAEYVNHKKALVKDVSKHVERVNGKMPTCVLIVFKTFELVIIVDQLLDLEIGTGLTFKYQTYELRIEHASN